MAALTDCQRQQFFQAGRRADLCQTLCRIPFQGEYLRGQRTQQKFGAQRLDIWSQTPQTLCGSVGPAGFGLHTQLAADIEFVERQLVFEGRRRQLTADMQGGFQVDRQL